MSSAPGREDLTGAATAAIVLAAFGCVWALGCLSAFSDTLFAVLLVLSVAVTGGLLFLSLRLRRAAARLPRRPMQPSEVARIRGRFNLVGVVQGLGIGVVVFAGIKLGRPEWIPASVALIVGLHFFPLATLFRTPLYNATGAGLCLVAVATPMLAFGSDAVWSVVPGLGAAAILWVTSAIAATNGLAAVRHAL